MNIRGFSFLILLGVAGFLYSSAHAEVVDRIEAIVNKKAIFKSDIARFRKLAPLRIKVDPIFANSAIAKESHPSDTEVMNFLIDEELIAEKFPVSDSDVEQEVNGIQNNLHIDREALRGALSREGFQFDDYFSLMRISLAKRQLIDREIRNKAAVSDDDIRAEYNLEHAGSKSFRGSFHVFLIQIPKARFKTSALAKTEAGRALEDLKKEDAGKTSSFKKIAQEYNENESDGDLGYLPYREMSSTLQKEVRNLGTQKISPIFDDGKNYSIVKVSDIKSDDDSGLQKEKNAIRGKLMEHEFQHQIRLWLDRERSLNYVKINSKKS